jgi:hypothetical protein
MSGGTPPELATNIDALCIRTDAGREDDKAPPADRTVGRGIDHWSRHPTRPVARRSLPAPGARYRVHDIADR